MKKKKIGILLMVLLVLVVCYFGVDHWSTAQEEKEAEKAKNETVKVKTLEKVTGISYTYDGNAFAFQKKDDTWIYVPDPDFPLAQSYAETMANTFSDMEATRKLSNPDALKDYGLETPAYTIALTDEKGETISVYIGNAADGDYYMTLGDKKDVYTVGSSVPGAIQYDLKALIQNDTFPSISSTSLKTVSIETKDGAKQETKEYDAGKDADEEQIKVIAEGLGAVRLTDYEDYHMTEAEAATYGLNADARTTVTVVYKNGDADETVEFYIGGSNADGTNRYVQKKDSSIVYKVAADTIKKILGTEK